jgi:hypothetical protein
MKSRIHRQFERQIADRGLSYEALADGMAVQVDQDTVFEPDALVRSGPLLPDDTLLVLDPLIVVPTKRIVIHHTRAADRRILGTSPGDDEILRLDPPGLEVSLAELFIDDQSGGAD